MTVNSGLNKDIVQILENSNVKPRNCMKCGKCSATCPAYEAMDIKPHQFVSYILNGKIDELLSSESIKICLSCFACVERCPRGVEPANLIDGVRKIAVRKRDSRLFLTDLVDEVPNLIEEDTPQQLLMSVFRKFRG